jgi:hypothetical protein
MSRPIALAPTSSNQEGKAVRSKRLVIELGRRASADLAWLVEEQEVNKTTVVNRAIQVYRLLIETQRNGGSIMLSDPVHGDTPLRIVA